MSYKLGTITIIISTHLQLKDHKKFFPYKKILTNRNSLNIVPKCIGDVDEFKLEMKQNFLSNYNEFSECLPTCYSCKNV